MPDKFVLAKKNKNKAAGFLDDERTEFQKHLDTGFIDVFRHLHPEQTGAYTYWNQIRPANRQNNVGWRIDYILFGKNPQTLPQFDICDCDILPNEYGSDHCPIYLAFKEHTPSELEAKEV